MKAVNLIPADQRRGAGGVAGRAGGVAYVMVGVLVVLVGMAVMYAVATKQVADRKGKIATTSAQADAAQAQAQALQPYVTFASLSQQRRAAVVSLAGARFNWSGAMDQIARALPADVTLSSLAGGTSGASGSSTTPGSGPSFAFAGCATSHPNVADTLVKLRKIAGVADVALSASQKAAAAAGGATGTSPSPGGSACRFVSFHGVVTFASTFTVGASASAPQNGPVPAAASAVGTTATAVAR
jgi:Tfp pilus assembly protein PilN